MSVIIGLTGSIGTGKSTISKMFTDRGIPVVDADLIAREVVEPGAAAYAGIVEIFGEEILLPDGKLDRKALGSIVFADEAKRVQLNKIVHPAIRAEMVQQRDEYLATNHAHVVMDIPLLFESKLTDYVDKILVVYVDADVQLERITKRDNSSVAEAKQRIASQIPVAEKVKQADAVIDNNGTMAQAEKQLTDILSTWS